MLKIYGISLSVHTRKVIIAAIDKGLDYEIIPVAPIDPTSLPPEWPQLSPTGKVPVIQDGDFVLADSTVISAYLDRAYPARPLYPAETRHYIQALWLEEYADGILFREVVHPLFHQTFVGPRLHQRPADQAAVNTVCQDVIPRVFGYLDSVVGKGFAAGPALSMADIAIASNLATYQYLGFPLDRQRFPALAAHFERSVCQPALQKALRAEQSVVDSMGLRRDFLQGLVQ
jgi:glutathione S-transferase